MPKTPSFVTWRLETASPNDLIRLEHILQTAVHLDATYSDEIITIKDGQEVSEPISHRLGDYFDVVCILPQANGDSRSLRLFFQCKPNVGRFWKDVMASVLQTAHQMHITTCIAMDY